MKPKCYIDSRKKIYSKKIYCPSYAVKAVYKQLNRQQKLCHPMQFGDNFIYN